MLDDIMAKVQDDDLKSLAKRSAHLSGHLAGLRAW